MKIIHVNKNVACDCTSIIVKQNKNNTLQHIGGV